MGVISVMAIDPGGKTGVARGRFELQGSLRETLRNGERIEAWEVEGNTEEQAWELASEYLDWSGAESADGVGLPDIYLVVESFRVRKMSADVSPIEVRSGIKAILVKEGVVAQWIDQEPGDAKGFAHSDRLKEWGLYRYGRGSDHKRDALRHLALRVARSLG